MHSIKSIFNVLISQRIRGVSRHVVPVRTFFSSFTFSFHPKRTYMWSISFVVGSCSCQLHEQITRCLSFPHCSTWCCTICVRHLFFHILCVELFVDIAFWHFIFDAKSLVTHLNR